MCDPRARARQAALSRAAARAAALALAALLAAGCRGSEAGRPRLGFALRDFASPFHVGLRRGAETASVGRAFLSIADAGGQQRVQDDQIGAFLKGQVGALAVSLASTTAAASAVALAKEAKTPLVFIGLRPPAEAMTAWDKVYYVGTGPEESGARAGAMLAAWWKANPAADRDRDGRMLVACLPAGSEGSPESLRAQAAVEALAKAGVEAALAADLPSRRVRGDAPAAERLAAALAANPEALLCGDAASAAAAATAVAKGASAPAGASAGGSGGSRGTEPPPPAIVSFESSPEVARAIGSGTILGAAVDDAEAIGTAAFRLSLVMARGQDATKAGYAISDAKYAWIPCQALTKSSLPPGAGG